MTAEDWVDPAARSVALFIDGATDPDIGADGTPMVDGDFLLLVNAWWEPLTLTVPADLSARQWSVVCDTHDPARKVTVAQELTVGPRSNRDLAIAVELSFGHGITRWHVRGISIQRTLPP